MDTLFVIAMFFLPFDNLFFAPSTGWATITPIIFFIYVFFNILKCKIRYRNIFLFIAIMLICSIINYSFVGFNIDAIIDTLVSLVMGISTLLAFDIYFIQKKKNAKKIIKILAFSYTLSLLFGIAQYLTIKVGIPWLFDFISLVSKRNYLLANRIQFSFTEPSYISMHLFGVLLPAYLLTKNKSVLNVFLLYTLTALLIGSSTRYLVDLAVIFVIVLFLYLIHNKKYIHILSFICFAGALIFFIYSVSPRIRGIINQGVYADASLASRYFRINASINGYKENTTRFLLGYGLGNSIIPIRAGYREALKDYKNQYLVEVYFLNNPEYHHPSVSFCMYTRIISEFGFIAFLIILRYIYKTYKKSSFRYKKELIFITLYLYLQFDAYAFYTIWIVIFALTNYEKLLEINGGTKK